jgi:uncharacterized membrane protein
MAGVKKVLWACFFVFLIAVSGWMICYAGGVERTPLRPVGGYYFARAKITEITESNINPDENAVEMQGNQVVVLDILDGKYAGESYSAQCPYTNQGGAKAEVGLVVTALISENNNGDVNVSVFNYERSRMILLLAGLFALSLVLVGGRKGLMAVIGLLFTFECVFCLYIPMMYTGVSPFLAAVLTCVMVTFVVMVLIGGWCRKTVSAILGTACGVVSAGLIALVFGHLMHISGLNVQEIETLAFVADNSKLNVSGLMFSGILIAALGAAMDVSMSVASAMAEIYEKNRNISCKELFLSGMHVGRDMTGTMSNTLILAFVGGSVGTIMIIYAYNMQAYEWLNRYDIGIEILQSVSGSIGVVLTVPFVALISALLFTKPRFSS